MNETEEAHEKRKNFKTTSKEKLSKNAKKHDLKCVKDLKETWRKFKILAGDCFEAKKKTDIYE